MYLSVRNVNYLLRICRFVSLTKKNWCELLLFTLPCSQALVKPIKKENMKEESTPYTRREPAQTIPVLLYSFNLPDFDYKNSAVCTRTQVYRDPWRVRWERCGSLFSQSDSKFRKSSPKCQLNRELFCGFLYFFVLMLHYYLLTQPLPPLVE